MKFSCLFSLFLILLSCNEKTTSGRTSQNQAKSMEINEKLFPVFIKFGAYGRQDSEPNILIEVASKLTFITIRGKDRITLKTETTDYIDTLNKLPLVDLKNEKNYTQKFIRDGSYFEVSNPFGRRRFTNIFPNIPDAESITPDATDIEAFTNLYSISVKLIEDSNVKKH